MAPFLKLFWGFLVVFVDVRINGFDVLPDVAGYILIVIALSELARRNERFGRARPFAMVLLALSVIDLFTRSRAGGSGTELFGSSGLAAAYGLALLVIDLMLVYFICRGIAEMAGATSDLAFRAKTRWLFFLWAAIAGQALVTVVFLRPDVVIGLVLVAIVANLIAAALICGLLLQAHRTFG